MIHQDCSHQIVLIKINLNIFYTNPYTQRTWDYGKGNHECTNNAIKNLDWQKAFLNINLHTQVILFNEIVTNIILNFVLNKLISVTDSVPLWVAKKLRNYWKTKSELHKLNIKYNRRKGDYEKILNMTTNITAESSISKKSYFNNLAEKLCDLKFHYCGIFKSFKSIGKKNSKHTSS